MTYNSLPEGVEEKEKRINAKSSLSQKAASICRMPLRFKHMPAHVSGTEKGTVHKDNHILLCKGHCKTPSNLVPQWSQTFPEFPGQSSIPLYYLIFFYYVRPLFLRSQSTLIPHLSNINTMFYLNLPKFSSWN